MTAKLLAVAQELISSRELARTSGLGEAAAKPGAAGGPELVRRGSAGGWVHRWRCCGCGGQRCRCTLHVPPASPPTVHPGTPSPLMPWSRLLQGTLENAVEQLELYRNVLDNR